VTIFDFCIFVLNAFMLIKIVKPMCKVTNFNNALILRDQKSEQDTFES